MSLMHGRSMDFEELREYSIGDEIKDIDWKASARNQFPLVKRYIATRKHPVLFVVDTGRNMDAITGSGENKKDIAINAVGILGYLATRHADTVGAIMGDSEKTVRVPFKETESHLEHLLARIDKSVTLESAEGNIKKQLDYVARTVKTRGLLVVVADEIQPDTDMDILLKKLKRQHEVLWISVGDGDPLSQIEIGDGAVVDIESGEFIPDFIRSNKKLSSFFNDRENVRKNFSNHYLTHLGLSHETISDSGKTVPLLLKLLERRLSERRR